MDHFHGDMVCKVSGSCTWILVTRIGKDVIKRIKQHVEAMQWIWQQFRIVCFVTCVFIGKFTLPFIARRANENHAILEAMWYTGKMEPGMWFKLNQSHDRKGNMQQMVQTPKMFGTGFLTKFTEWRHKGKLTNKRKSLFILQTLQRLVTVVCNFNSFYTSRIFFCK